MPVAVKLSPYFSSTGEIAIRLDQAGADGLVLFNRFMQPDIDPETLAVTAGVQLSQPGRGAATRAPGSPCCADGYAPRWPRPPASRTPVDVAKYLLAGADVVMTTSALLRHGPEHATRAARRPDRLDEPQGVHRRATTCAGLLRVPPEEDQAGYERSSYVTAIQAGHAPYGA